MRLLQEPILALEQRIKQEIEENPALEEMSSGDEDGENQVDDNVSDSIDAEEDEFTDDSSDTVANENDDFTLEDYMEEDEIPDYRLFANNKSPDEEVREFPVVSGTSFQDYLLDQLGMYKMSDRMFIIASTIIGNLDDSGYLQRDIDALVDDLAFNQSLEVTREEVLAALKVIQEFDPAGIGSRNLQECLILQLERKPRLTGAIEVALEILKNYFPEFSKKHYEKILLKARISEMDLKKAINEIQKLNPKPGVAISEVARENNYIVPDFLVTNSDGVLELSLNSRNAPELMLNRQYMEILRGYSTTGRKVTSSDKAAMAFIKQKLESAKGFIDAIRQRQETLYITMKAILDYQKEYFLTGDETRLRPMILKDIATVISMDISTVSRVVNSKYVQTPFGTFQLKSFFSESMQNTRGEEISTREVKKILQDCIAGEKKSDPFTDDHLVSILKSKGYNIARRTIAKYREQLNIPVARLRKEI
jgi:RNA polymerase sigma-54 factor